MIEPLGARRQWRMVIWLLLALLGALGLLGHAARDSAAQPSLPRFIPLPDLNEKDPPADEIPDSDDPEAAGSPEGSEDEDSRSEVGERFGPSIREFPFSGGEGQRIIVVEIKDVIDLGLAPFVERQLAAAAEAGDVVAFISEIDTPGGRVDAAMRIRDALLRSKVPTIAFINTQAISAGALIAYAHDHIIVAEGGSMGAATPVQMGGTGQSEQVDEKMVSYMRSAMRATAEAKERDGDLAEAMVDRTIVIDEVSPEGKLLTASTRQLLAWGIADAQADSFDEMLAVADLGAARIERPTLSWAEQLARVLTHPVVASLLMSLGFLGLLMELYSPGFGFPGILGLVCLVLFFAGHMIVKLAGLEELLLFLVGLVLIGVEVFVTPGFGVLGALGAVALLISLVLSLIGLPISVSFDTGALLTAVARVGLAAITTLVGAFVALQFLPRSRRVRRLVLTSFVGEPQPAAAGDARVSARGSASVERPSDTTASAALVGARGKTTTALRPGGRAEIAGRRYDVVSLGDFIDKGVEVQVVEASPMRVVVRRRRDASGQA